MPGCGYNDYQSPSRTGRSFCMAHCSKGSDCRQSEGYTCSDPTSAPWNAAILDNNQSQSVCIASPTLLADASASPDAAVCMSFGTETGDASDDASDIDAERGANAADAADAATEEPTPGSIPASTRRSTRLDVDTGSADAPGGG